MGKIWGKSIFFFATEKFEFWWNDPFSSADDEFIQTHRKWHHSSRLLFPYVPTEDWFVPSSWMTTNIGGKRENRDFVGVMSRPCRSKVLSGETNTLPKYNNIASTLCPAEWPISRKTISGSIQHEKKLLTSSPRVDEAESVGYDF